MEYIQMPTDIKKYVKKKIVTRVVSLILLITLSTCINALLWDVFVTKSSTAIHIVFIIITLLLPFIISGVPIKLIDESWRGVAKDVEIRTGTGVYTNGAGQSFPYVKHIVILTVERNGGKIQKIAIKEYGERSHKGFAVPLEGNIRQHLDDYSIGDEVYHFYGLPTCLVVSADKKRTNCVICGGENVFGEDKCHNCGHSLIKIQ